MVQCEEGGRTAREKGGGQLYTVRTLEARPSTLPRPGIETTGFATDAAARDKQCSVNNIVLGSWGDGGTDNRKLGIACTELYTN